MGVETMDAYAKKKKDLAHLFLEAAEEEDSAVFALSMLAKSKDQLDVFGESKDKVLACIDLLIKDTVKHREMLFQIAHRLSDPRASYAR